MESLARRHLSFQRPDRLSVFGFAKCLSHGGRGRVKRPKSLMRSRFTNVDRNTLNHIGETIGGWEIFLFGVHSRHNRRVTGKLMSRNFKARAHGKNARFSQT